MDTGESAKAERRREILSARSGLTVQDVRVNADVLAQRAAGLPELAGAGVVAAYVSVGREPGTLPLLEVLRERGVRVLLPVLLADDDLDWAEYGGPGMLVRAGRGLLEPTGPRLGPQAVTACEAMLLPGVAVDGRGMRLGRGGGSYDRVLARLAAAGARPALVVLLYDGEVLPEVPAEPHDRPVTAALTPSGVHRFGPAGDGA